MRWTVTVLLLAAACTSGTAPPSAVPAVTTAPAAPSTRPPAVVTPRLRTPTPTRTSTARPAVPPVSRAARAAGLVDVRTVVPDAILDLRYATTHNFTGVRLYPHDARCLVHRSLAAGLRVAAARLRAQGYRLVFWDCYRPHTVQIRMFEVVSDPDWVARPGPYARSHEAARSVDVTLARAGHEVDMGTGFDDFTDRAHAFATDVGAAALANRTRLRHAMLAGGLQVYSGEWWHFDGPGAFVRRPVLDVPVD